MEDLQNMKRIGFNDINNMIDILFKDRPEYVFGSFSKTSITPQISSFKIKKNDNKNICSLDDRNKIRNLFIYNSFPKENEIDKNLYISISNFMLGVNIPEEEKKIVSEFLTDDIKEYIFNDFFEITEKISKSFTNDTGLFFDDNNEIIECPFKYNPIINGIPLKDFESDKKWIGSKKLYDIIQSGIIPDNTFEAIALKSFVESYDLTNKQWCPEKLKNFKQQFEDEKVKEKIDNWIKQLDKEKISFLKNADFVEHSVKMNEKIKEKLINDVPQDFNQMEKSMYLYIKLCQIFSYDDDYYKNKNTEKKGKISNISEYDNKNNKIVCYEFAYMYSELLREIGIEHIREKRPPGIDRFANSHANIEFLVDDFAIFADSTVEVETGDLINAKTYDRLNGFRCLLYDQDKQNKFITSLEKVYNYVKEKDKEKEAIPQKDDIKDLDTIEKLKLFNQYMEKSKFKDIDLLSYFQKLKVAMFTNDDKVEFKYLDNLLYNVSLTGWSLITDDLKKIEYTIDMSDRQVYSDIIDEEKNIKSNPENNSRDIEEERAKEEMIERIFGKQQIFKKQEKQISELKKIKEK